MTVATLKLLLDAFPDDTEIVVYDDHGVFHRTGYWGSGVTRGPEDRLVQRETHLIQNEAEIEPDHRVVMVLTTGATP